MTKRLSSKEQEELVLKNQGLIRYIVEKFGISPNDFDDMVSIGQIGLSKAAATFDKSKGVKFGTYAARCIQNEIRMYFRKENSHANDISMDDVITVDASGNDLLLVDTLSDPSSDFTEEIADRDINERLINIILNLLKPKERLIMLYKISGMNQRFIAKALNISQSYVSRLESKLVNELKLHFTTPQQFKEVFKMAIVGESYRISFSSKDVKNFNLIFATFLQSQTSAKNLPDFKVVCNSERIIIQVPAHPESFSFVAQIIQKIDDYIFSFVSNTGELTVDNKVLQELKSDKSNKAMENEEGKLITEKNEKVQAVKEDVKKTNTNVSNKQVVIDRKEIISDNLSTSIIEVDKRTLKDNNSTERKVSKQEIVRDYILSKQTFTRNELKQHFPDVSIQTINLVISDTKKSGVITSISKGKYTTKKD